MSDSGMGIVRTYHATRFYGVVLGPIYLVAKDVRLWPAFFSERNQIGCRHITLGHWRWVVRWRVTA